MQYFWIVLSWSPYVGVNLDEVKCMPSPPRVQPSLIRDPHHVYSSPSPAVPPPQGVLREARGAPQDRRGQGAHGHVAGDHLLSSTDTVQASTYALRCVAWMREERRDSLVERATGKTCAGSRSIHTSRPIVVLLQRFVKNGTNIETA